MTTRAWPRCCRRVRIRFEPAEGGGQRVLLDGVDVSAAIRTPPMSLGASAVSARPVVRDALLELQRRLATAEGNRGAVLEGRDIGTVVFPDADIKFFLTAAPEVRARRRHDELQAKGQPVPMAQVLAEQEKRDSDDSRRAVAPLRAADDALLVDTSGLSLDGVVDALADAVAGALGGRGPLRLGCARMDGLERTYGPKECGSCRLWRPILEDARGPIGPCRLNVRTGDFPGSAPRCERYLARDAALPAQPPPPPPVAPSRRHPHLRRPTRAAPRRSSPRRTAPRSSSSSRRRSCP